MDDPSILELSLENRNYIEALPRELTQYCVCNRVDLVFSQSAARRRSGIYEAFFPLWRSALRSARRRIDSWKDLLTPTTVLLIAPRKEVIAHAMMP